MKRPTIVQVIKPPPGPPPAVPRRVKYTAVACVRVGGVTEYRPFVPKEMR